MIDSFPLPAWVTLDTSAPYPKWVAAFVEYIGVEHECNNGSTNVYVRTETPEGAYAQNVIVWQDWTDDRAAETTKPQGEIDYCGEPYGASFFQSGDSSFSPERGEHGPYAFYVQDKSVSDVVQGLGLPLKRHVQYKIVFRLKYKADEDDDPPSPAPKQWVIVKQRDETPGGKPARIVLEYK